MLGVYRLRAMGMRMFIAIALLSIAVAGTATGSTQATRPLACTAPLVSVDGKLEPYRGCSPYAFVGGSIFDLVVVKDRVHVISGVTADKLLVGTFAEAAGGKLDRVSCYGRPLEPRFGPAPPVATGCTPAPQGIGQVDPPWLHDFSPDHIAASPDGRHLYVGSNETSGPGSADRIEILRRSTNGDLSFQGCVSAVDARPATPCAVIMREFTYQTGQIAISPDGDRLYTVGGHGLLALARAGGGDLTPLGCTRLYQTMCREAGSKRSIAGHGNPLAVSPDSKYLYVLDSRLAKNGYDQAVIEVFARTAASPGLRRVQTFLLPTPSGGAEALALTPDGRMLYVAWTEHLFGLARSKATGRLTKKSCLVSRATGSEKGCPAARFEFGYGMSPELAFSPDGRTLALAEVDVVIFRRTPSTGALTQIGCVPHAVSKRSTKVGCSKVWAPFNTTGNRREIAFSSDGKRLYVSNESSLTTIGL